MATLGELEHMTSSDLDFTSQTETEDTDTGDLEDSGTTFSSSDGTETSISSISTSCSTKSSMESQNAEMKSLSSADGSTSTGSVDQSDSEQSNLFKYPSLPKHSFDLTEVSELSNFENLSNYECKISSATSAKDNKKSRPKLKKPFHLPDFISMKRDWYKHPCFKSYWEHYDRVMSWCNKHYQVHNSIMKKEINGPATAQAQGFNQISSIFPWQQSYLNPYYSNFGNQFYKQGDGGSMNSGSVKRKFLKKKRKKKKAKSRSVKGQGQNVTIEDSDENFEMEITDEMMEFFKKSEEHRRERDKEKKSNDQTEEKEKERVNIEDVKVTATKGPTTEAPKQRPGARRMSEMKVLYGKGAPMIHGMETALQMTFDRNLDVNEPKMWPNMPLKLVFG